MAVVAVEGIGFSLSRPLAPGHGSEGASGQTVGVVVASEAGVHVVVVDSDAVAIVAVESISVSGPLAIVVADNTVEPLGGPGSEGGGNTRVGSDTASVGKGKSVAVAVEGISVSVSAPLSVGIGTGSVDSALTAEPNSGGPGGGDAGGTDQGVAVRGVERVGGGGRGQAGGDQD